MSLKHQAVWKFLDRNADAEARLIRDLGIAPIIAATLVTRGICESAQANRFLSAGLDELHSPSLLPDIDKAVRSILAAREAGEIIFLHGDYDVDGITSTTLFFKFLTKIGCNVIPHVPHRVKEGYGINATSVIEAAQLGSKLFLTCDCGTGAIEQIKAARELGMRVVVTDHHQVATLPEAEAVVNPHRSDSQYPFSDLCGVGVVFKVCQAITEELKLNVESFQNAYIDLVALGTVADAMPLIDENRILVKRGLPALTNTKKVGLQALYETANLGDALRKGLGTYEVGFRIAPRINAIGRVNDASIALQLMLSSSKEEALGFARTMEIANDERKQIQESITNEALEQLRLTEQQNDSIVIVSGKDWPAGVVGLVAGKIAEQYNRPAIVMYFDEESQEFKGSGRSIERLDLAQMIRSLPNLVSGGGHAMAAGLHIGVDSFDEAKSAIKQYVVQTLQGVDLRPVIRITSEVNLSEINLSTVEQLALVEPFGMGNPRPFFAATAASIASIKPTRNPDHPQLLIRQGDSPLTQFSAFNFGEAASAWKLPLETDIAFELGVNEWNGNRKVDWRLKAVSKVADLEPEIDNEQVDVDLP